MLAADEKLGQMLTKSTSCIYLPKAAFIINTLLTRFLKSTRRVSGSQADDLLYPANDRLEVRLKHADKTWKMTNKYKGEREVIPQMLIAEEMVDTDGDKANF